MVSFKIATAPTHKLQIGDRVRCIDSDCQRHFKRVGVHLGTVVETFSGIHANYVEVMWDERAQTESTHVSIVRYIGEREEEAMSA
jgi:hypothetical protein